MTETTQPRHPRATEGAASAPDDLDGASGRRARRAMIMVVVTLALITIAGIALVLWYVNAEREREIQNWQVRLGIVADGRVGALTQWLDEQVSVLTRLSTNANLQLYVMDLMAATGEDAEQVEGRYVRNILDATANQAGFMPDRRSSRVNANVGTSVTAGLAVLDRSGDIIVGSEFMPGLPEGFGAALARASDGRPVVTGPRTGPTGERLLGVVVPLYAVQQSAPDGSQLGYIVGLRPFNNTVFGLLDQPGNAWRSAQTYLVRDRDGSVSYLTPLADGTPPMGKSLSLRTPELAAASAIEAPGLFGFGRDHAGTDVLFTSRAVPGTDWILVHTVSRAEALAESNARLRTLLIVFILVIVGVLGGSVALWRHGTSVRLAEIAARYKLTADRLNSHMKFLRVVTDGQPTAIAAVDENDHYTFANREAVWGADLEPESLLGMTLSEVMGPHDAGKVRALNQRVLLTQSPASEVLTLERDGQERMIKSDHIPLAADRDHPRSVLMVMQDVTELMAERARREATMRDLVGTLVSLVDQRDPFSANHSAMVAEVSRAVAEEMGESGAVRQTVDIAGNLMNLGKILVPEDILTKSGALTDEEFNIVRMAMVRTADMLSGVSFDLPVAECLRQLQERWDGTGYPDALAGERICVEARIVMVANAFVGMVSPRAFRSALPIEKVTSILMEDAGKRYDMRPVAALVNYLQNRGGAERWRAVGQSDAAGDGS